MTIVEVVVVVVNPTTGEKKSHVLITFFTRRHSLNQCSNSPTKEVVSLL